jgi:DNA-binding FadR family transcriptional regulator
VLDQNYPGLSYHVQDGASVDDTVEILKSYGDRISWQSKPDGGQADAINAGFAGVDCDVMTSSHLARIELALIEADNAETIQEFEAANRAFHHALVAPCAMPRLLANLDELQLANSRLVFAMAHSVGWRPRSNQDHRLILQALRMRNVDQACSLLARHIQTIERLTIPAS